MPIFYNKKNLGVVIPPTSYDTNTTGWNLNITSTTGGTYLYTNTTITYTTPIAAQYYYQNWIFDQPPILKQSGLTIIKRKRDHIEISDNPAEMKARSTLRDMLTEREFRRYITNGFIVIKGKSGYWYQIFNDLNKKIRVYKNNKQVGLLCIHTDNKCPPTDHVINMKLLIELDETSIWLNANWTQQSNVDPLIKKDIYYANVNAA